MTHPTSFHLAPAHPTTAPTPRATSAARPAPFLELIQARLGAAKDASPAATTLAKSGDTRLTGPAHCGTRTPRASSSPAATRAASAAGEDLPTAIQTRTRETSDQERESDAGGTADGGERDGKPAVPATEAPPPEETAPKAAPEESPAAGDLEGKSGDPRAVVEGAGVVAPPTAQAAPAGKAGRGGESSGSPKAVPVENLPGATESRVENGASLALAEAGAKEARVPEWIKGPTAPSAGNGPTTAARAVRSEESPAGDEGVSKAGTWAAESVLHMSSALDMTNPAASGEQKLPPGADRGLALPGLAGGPREDRAGGTPSDATALFPLGAGWSPVSGEESWGNPVESTLTQGTSRVDRMQEVVNEAVTQIRRHGLGDYSVTLKPDAQTEIVLHITCQQGEAQVRAELQKGDLGALSAQWGELQERLARQEVRLAPLEESGAMSSRSGDQAGSGFAQHQSARDTDKPVPVGIPPFSAQRRGEKQVAGAARLAARGWESWA